MSMTYTISSNILFFFWKLFNFDNLFKVAVKFLSSYLISNRILNISVMSAFFYVSLEGVGKEGSENTFLFILRTKKIIFNIFFSFITLCSANGFSRDILRR